MNHQDTTPCLACHPMAGVPRASAAAVVLVLSSLGWVQPGMAQGRKPAAPQVVAQKKTGNAAVAGARPGPSEPATRICAGETPNPVVVNVVFGKSTLLRFHDPIALRTLADSSIIQARLLSPQTVYIVGMHVGSTNMVLQDIKGHCTVVQVSVAMDPEGLRAQLSQLLPGETGIKVAAASDSLVLSGAVSDTIKLDHALSLANAYVRQQLTAVGAPGTPSLASLAGAAPPPLAGAGGGAYQNPRVINMLSVTAPQQVMIEVKVAEVSKTLTDKLGASFSAQGGGTNWRYGLSSGFSSGGSALISAIKTGNLSLVIDAERDNSLIKILAEPNVMALSGHEGSFLAGGKVYIPVPQSSSGTGTTITLQEETFGIGVKFTPTVLADGLIHLKVSPEVSELSSEGMKLSASGVTQVSVLPLITTRRAATTVQLADGQSFVIGGLIKHNVTTNIKAFPVLGEIPVLGALFRSSAFVADRSEVLFVVTPRLVKPVAGEPVALPTDSYVEPTRAEVLLGGRLEGARSGEAATAAPPSGTSTPVAPTRPVGK